MLSALAEPRSVLSEKHIRNSVPMKTWEELLEAFKKLVDEAVGDKKGDEAKTARAESYAKLPREVRQHFNDAGRAAAEGPLNQEVTDLKEENEKLTTQAETAESRVQELEKDPEGATKREAELKEENESLTTQLADEKAGRKTDTESHKAENEKASLEGMIKDLIATGSKRFDSAWFELEVRKAQDENRIRVVDGKIQIIAKGLKTPIAEETTEGLITAFIDEVATDAPDTRVLSDTDNGAGTDGKGGSGNGIVDQARKAAERLKADPAAIDKEIEERLSSLG